VAVIRPITNLLGLTSKLIVNYPTSAINFMIPRCRICFMCRNFAMEIKCPRVEVLSSGPLNQLKEIDHEDESPSCNVLVLHLLMIAANAEGPRMLPQPAEPFNAGADRQAQLDEMKTVNSKGWLR